MSNENLPPSFNIALDVEESEYQKAKLQVVLLWTVTMIAPLIGLGLWAIGLRLGGWMAQAVALGVATHMLMYKLLPEARKMSTLRMKKYKELRELRMARERRLGSESQAQPAKESDQLNK